VEQQEAKARKALANTIRTARRRWGLSQAQFASLFATSVRSVRRWESSQLEPREHQLWIFSLLIGYASAYGVKQFLLRFANQAGRLSKPGRPRSG
jgi:DNA-binding transcriptional regulator YiaG